jgi:RNA polymerase sigma-70 factor, ECF subfamily
MPRHASALSVRELLDAHGDFVWRVFRRMGLQEAAADDALQQVFVVAFQRLHVIEQGCERAFLYKTAMNIATHLRYVEGRSRETLYDEDALDERAELSVEASLDDILDQRRARAILDEALAAMPEQLRAVLVLIEIEEMTASEAAECLGIPSGTVASRLRRARALFDRICVRILQHSGARSKR